MRLRRLEPVLRLALRGPCALPRGSRLLVAVSGGADSTALLAALASIAREFDLALTAAHLHHGLRGADADADLVHVRALCAHLRVPLIAARWDTRARMRRERLAGEAGLRTLRRRFLRGAARRAGAAAIATAHTADDQLETVLMRLARGTGMAGLGGMWPRAGAWMKPLLGATRRDVEHDLARAGLGWREDATNRTREAFRNRVRLDVVPALAAAVAPGARDPRASRAALALRAAAGAADVRTGAALAGAVARRALARARAANPGATPRALGADVAPLLRLPEAARGAALRLLWRRAHGAGDGLARVHVEALAKLLAGREGGGAALPGGWRARRSAGRLEISPPSPVRSRSRRPLAAGGAGTAPARLHGSGAPTPSRRRPGGPTARSAR